MPAAKTVHALRSDQYLTHTHTPILPSQTCSTNLTLLLLLLQLSTPYNDNSAQKPCPACSIQQPAEGYQLCFQIWVSFGQFWSALAITTT